MDSDFCFPRDVVACVAFSDCSTLALAQHEYKTSAPLCQSTYVATLAAYSGAADRRTLP